MAAGMQLLLCCFTIVLCVGQLKMQSMIIHQSNMLNKPPFHYCAWKSFSAQCISKVWQHEQSYECTFICLCCGFKLNFFQQDRNTKDTGTKPCHQMYIFYSYFKKPFFMVALCNRADHTYFHPVSFFFFFLFFPRLISAVGDWMSAILPHMVWP